MRVVVKVAELRDVLLEGRVLEGYSNVGLDRDSASEIDEALKTLYKKHNVLIV